MDSSEGKLEGTLELTLEEGIDRAQLMGIFDRVLEAHGCPACGLVGLDLHLFQIRPEVSAVDNPLGEDVPGLQSATFRPPR